MRNNTYNHEFYRKILISKIEQKFGKQVKYSKDCKNLSSQIYSSVSRQLSISTIKRFFQLIPSPFNPSKYTLDTFSIFAGYANFESFNESVRKDEKEVNDINILNQLKINVLQISEASKYSLTQKSHYNPVTFVHRAFAEKYLERFINSRKTATILIAPTGFGKSALLLQWYNTHFSGNDARYKDDIVCLIDGGLFFTFYHQAQENEILNQLLDFDFKISQKLFQHKEKDNQDVRFFLIIDDVDKVFSVREKFHLIAENIMRLLMINKNNSWFKVILTCRPENLEVFTSLVIPNPMLAEGFFNVNFRHRNYLEATNIPLFSLKELQKALAYSNSMVNYNYLSLYYSDIFNVINTPLFFSLLISDKYYTETEFTEIGFLNQLLQQFYFSPPFAEEKQFLINKFIHLYNVEEEYSSVGKDTLLAGSDSRLIYQELVKAGLIFEYIDPSDTPGVNLKVRFANKNIFEYLLIRTLLNENSDSTALLHDVFENYKHNIPTQNALLKWVVKIAFFDDNVEFIKQIHKLLELQVNVSNELVNETMPGSLRSIQNAFIECLRSKKQLCHMLLPWLAKSRLGQKLYFEEYFDMDNLMNVPEKSIEVYAQSNGTYDGQMVARFIVFIKAYYSLDYETCASEFEKIGKINYTDLQTPLGLGYYFSSWFLYASLIGYENKNEMLKRFLSYSDKTRLKRLHTFRFIPPFEFFVVYNLNGCGFFDEVRLVVESLNDTYSLSTNNVSCFTQYYKLCYARSLLHTGDPELALEYYNEVKMSDFPRHIEHFMKLNSSLILIEFLEYQKNILEALNMLYETKALAREMGYNYFIKKADELELNLLKAKKDITK
jgi:hypothetical protein